LVIPITCGCFTGIIRGYQAEIVRNECDSVIHTVPAANLQETLSEMELTLDLSSAQCLHCGAALYEVIRKTCDNPAIRDFRRRNARNTRRSVRRWSKGQRLRVLTATCSIS
jgi:hypothetical protein